MIRNSLNVDLKIRAKKCLEHIWKNTDHSINVEQELIGQLPISLKEEILLESQGKFLKKFPVFFKNFSNEFIEKLSLDLKPIRYGPKDIIYSVIYIKKK